MLKNITLSAEEEMITKAREKALRRKTTLNAEFRHWLRDYAGQGRQASEYYALMGKLSYARPGRKFSRDEMNER